MTKFEEQLIDQLSVFNSQLHDLVSVLNGIFSHDVQISVSPLSVTLED